MFIKERINLSKERGNTLIANNKKAYHEYFIEEVKSIRQGHCSIKEAFVGIDHGEVYVYRMNVNPYERGNIFNKDPLRTRKLLLHRYEINKLIGQQKVKGYTIMPLKVYIKDGLVKMEIGLAKGKKLYDKREDIAKKDMKREMERDLKNRNRE